METPDHHDKAIRSWQKGLSCLKLLGSGWVSCLAQAEWSRYLSFRRLCWHLHESRMPKAVLSLTRFCTVLLLLALPEVKQLVVVFMVASILVRVPQVRLPALLS